jgi:transporter family-2 protein
MNALWIIPFFRLGGALQSAGAAMNGQLNRSLGNPWLASAVTFALITFFFSGIFLVLPSPLPSAKALSQMPWWAPIGGLVGAVQVYAGLTLVNRIGAGPFVGLTVSAALISSLLIDHFGLLRVEQHSLNVLRVIGGVLLIGGVTLIAKF